MSTSIFTLKPEEYTRDIDVVSAYIRDAATYLHKRTGESLEKCLQYVKDTTRPGGKHGIRDPEVFCLSKDKPGERTPTTIRFSQYMQDTVERRDLMSPTMATYINPKIKRSLLAEYISINIKRRAQVKHEQFEAEMAGDEVLADFKKNRQTSFKTKNNSLSGAQASPYTPLVNKSAHSSLTSTCRSATGYGNANNEKFLFGNRHYWAPDVVKSNIISIINKTNYPQLEAALAKYGIRPPTHEETMECISYSTDLYWRNPVETASIRELVSSLNDLERAAFVYTGDLYHLAKYNEAVAREFLDKLSTKVTESLPLEEADHWVGQMDSDLKVFVSLLCAEELAGESIKDTKKRDLVAYGRIGATAQYVSSTLHHYADMIRALWVTESVPASVAMLPSSIRRGAVVSDTDSTIFTVQYWTMWFEGKLDFSEKSKAISYAVVYLASQTIIHVLARACAQMGVIPEQIHQLSMKNEYAFPVFSLTSRAKHYYAYISAQEGNVFKKFKTEVKGVALRSSNCPPHVMKRANEMICEVMDLVMAGNGISAKYMLGKVAAIENEIRRSVESGRYEYMTKTTVKNEASYKNPMSSAYWHHLFWQEVCAPKYGPTEPPIYSAVKVSIDAPNRTALEAWLASMEDQEFAQRMAEFLKRHHKTAITQLIVPEALVAVNGIPPEIVKGVNIRKLIAATMEPFYLILESLGLYMLDPNLTRLVSDTYQ